jgi:hypothetical protein
MELRIDAFRRKRYHLGVSDQFRDAFFSEPSRKGVKALSPMPVQAAHMSLFCSMCGWGGADGSGPTRPWATCTHAR